MPMLCSGMEGLLRLNGAQMKKKAAWNDHRGDIIQSDKGYDIIDCIRCGFKHIIPIPESHELEKIYSQEYYSKDEPFYIERHTQDLSWWNLVFAERYDTFESYLPQDRKRILDIGSGPGFFLQYGKKRGWTTVGVELSNQAVFHSRGFGLEIHQKPFSRELIPKLGKFDVIHLSEVLEHLADPIATVRIAHDMLSPGGLLCVVAPNDYNPLQLCFQRASGSRSWWISPPHHINYFDFTSLNALLINNEFDVLLTEATFPMDLFLLMGENYIDNDILGRKCHEKRKMLELNLQAELGGFKRRLYQLFGSLGIGREVQIFGRRK